MINNRKMPTGQAFALASAKACVAFMLLTLPGASRLFAGDGPQGSAGSSEKSTQILDDSSPDSWKCLGNVGGNRLTADLGTDPVSGQLATRFSGVIRQTGRWVYWERPLPTAVGLGEADLVSLEVYPLTAIPANLIFELGNLNPEGGGFSPIFRGQFGVLEEGRWNAVEVPKMNAKSSKADGVRISLNSAVMDTVSPGQRFEFLVKNVRLKPNR